MKSILAVAWVSVSSGMEISCGFLVGKQFIDRRFGIQVKCWLDDDSGKQKIKGE